MVVSFGLRDLETEIYWLEPKNTIKSKIMPGLNSYGRSWAQAIRDDDPFVGSQEIDFQFATLFWHNAYILRPAVGCLKPGSSVAVIDMECGACDE